MKNYKLLNKLKNSKSVCLISHINPDADAVASMVVFKDFLKSKFNVDNIDLFAETKNNNEYLIPILKNEKLNPKPKKYDTAVMMDSPNLDRLGIYRNLFEHAEFKIVIDHHHTNNFDGEINVVEPISSTCEIIYNILKLHKFPISKENKENLYSGITTDTNNFTVGNFNSNTFKVISEIADDINIPKLYEHFLGTNSLKTMQLLSVSINNLSLFESNKIIISHISKADSEKLEANDDDFAGIINKLATISNNVLVCLIYPKGNTYYVSMRSKQNYSVAEIAKKFGGGGHTGAAAFNSSLTIKQIKELILNEFKRILNKK